MCVSLTWLHVVIVSACLVRRTRVGSHSGLCLTLPTMRVVTLSVLSSIAMRILSIVTIRNTTGWLSSTRMLRGQLMFWTLRTTSTCADHLCCLSAWIVRSLCLLVHPSLPTWLRLLMTGLGPSPTTLSSLHFRTRRELFVFAQMWLILRFHDCFVVVVHSEFATFVSLKVFCCQPTQDRLGSEDLWSVAFCSESLSQVRWVFFANRWSPSRHGWWLFVWSLVKVFGRGAQPEGSVLSAGDFV